MADPDFEKTVFVIMPFGEEGTKEREQNDDTYDNIIKKAVKEADLRLVCIRADEIYSPGSVMDDVINYTVRSKYVIADLSDRNENVFYELGIRDSVDGKTILLCKKNQKLPFDLKDMRTVFYSKELVGESSEAIEKIKTYLLTMESSDGVFHSPVKIALRSESTGKPSSPDTKKPSRKTKAERELLPVTKPPNPELHELITLMAKRDGYVEVTMYGWPEGFQYWALYGGSLGVNYSRKLAAIALIEFEVDKSDSCKHVILEMVSSAQHKTGLEHLDIMWLARNRVKGKRKTEEDFCRLARVNLRPRTPDIMSIESVIASSEALTVKIAIHDDSSKAAFKKQLGL